jgi:hypothetical protein
MNRRGFFRSIGFLAAAITTGIALVNSPKPIKLKCKWTPEAEQDLQQMYGVKGDAFLATGYVYAPYIPLYYTPQVIGNSEFAKQFDKHCHSATMMA